MTIYEQRDELLQEARDSARLITKLRSERDAAIAAAVAAEREAYRPLFEACVGLVSYRDRNPLNFQLEKADDYIDQIAITAAAIRARNGSAANG